jgi:hypothetical protein
MEIQKVTFPNHPMQIFRHYYPNSLQGQENGAEKLVDIEPDVHSKITRPDGIDTCTCGLVYVQEDSHWMGHYGHRNHQTGELQPVARIKDEYTSPKGVTSVTISYRCEYCGSDEIGDRNFFSVKEPGSRRKNIHSCATDDFPLSRFEFEEARNYFHYRFPNSFFFTPTPNSLYFQTLGNVSVSVDSTGARLSGTGTHFREAMLELLTNRSMLMSVKSKRLQEIADKIYPSEVFNSWRVSDNRPNWLWHSRPGYEYASNGYIKFSSEEVHHTDLVEPNWASWDVLFESAHEALNFKTVQSKMTKDHFIVYGDKIALPLAQVPVIGLGAFPDLGYLDLGTTWIPNDPNAF